MTGTPDAEFWAGVRDAERVVEHAESRLAAIDATTPTQTREAFAAAQDEFVEGLQLLVAAQNDLIAAMIRGEA